MRSTDIEHLVELSRPAVHPSGAWAAVAASRPSIAANRRVGQLWRVSLADGSRTRLTQGVADAAPQLTPDGALLAFLRADDRDRTQVWVVRPDGGEPVRATDVDGGVQAFRISPDGATLALVVRDVEPGRGGTVEGLSAEAQSPRRIADLHALANGVGYRIDAHARVAVVPLLTPDGEPDYARAPAPSDAGADPTPEAGTRIPEARVLTSGDVDHRAIAWSVDGTEVLAVRAERGATPDLRSAVVAIPADGGDERVLVGTEHDLSIGAVEADADGLWLLAQHVGPTGIDFVARPMSLHRSTAEGLELRTDAETVDLTEGQLTLVEGGVLVQDRTRGRLLPVRVDASGVARLVDDAVEATGLGVGGGAIVASVQTPTSFGELALVEDGGLRVLTDFGAPLQAAGIREPIEVDLPARDGGSVHGWVWLPEGEGPHPVLLNIHGGPYAQYGVHVFDEAQVAVDAGYAVVQCNPRGSAGYGREHGLAIRQRMGTVDLHDVLDFLDGALAAHASLDADRVGIMGGSYGGYLTAWTIAHEHRFRAAVVERGFLDPDAFVGTSDIGSFFGDEYVGTDPELVASQSPLAVVDRVRTPTLVVHSERDLRCPLEQAQRYFAALHRQGTEAELLVFPGEDHELTRSGQPRHRIERFQAVLDWFGPRLAAG